MRLAYCRSCEWPIIWVVTEKGKNMPVDADPVTAPRGFRLEDQGDGVPPLARYVPHPAPDEKLYESHFSSCPNAAQHRKAS
jgi:hypothetical protein